MLPSSKMDSVMDCWSENSPADWPWSMAVCRAWTRSAALAATKASRQVVQAARSAAVGARLQRCAAPAPVVGMPGHAAAAPGHPVRTVDGDARTEGTTTKVVTEEAGSAAAMRV